MSVVFAPLSASRYGAVFAAAWKRDWFSALLWLASYATNVFLSLSSRD